MHDTRADEPFRDLVVAVAATFGVERVQPLRRHDHHFAVVVRLDEIQQRAVAFGLEGGIVLRAAGGDAGDETHIREGEAELTEYLGVHPVV